jgi:hypothetical protein
MSAHMPDPVLVDMALKLLRDNPHYVEDARQGVKVHNSVIGGVVAMQHKAPRWAAEDAVRVALLKLDGKTRRRKT